MLLFNLYVRIRSSLVVSLKCYFEFLFLFFVKMRYRFKVVGKENNYVVSWDDGYCEFNVYYFIDNWLGMFW